MEKLSEYFTGSTGLTDEHFEQFIKLAEKKVLKKKDFLIKAGSVCDFVALIEQGVIRSFVIKGDEEFNTDFYFENNFTSVYSSYVNTLPSEHYIQALTDSTVYIFPLEKMEKLAASDLQWLKLGKYLAEFFLIRKCQREISFLKQTAPERMENMRLSYPGIEQKVQQYHLASYLGIKPESLSRIKLLDYKEPVNSEPVILPKII